MASFLLVLKLSLSVDRSCHHIVDNVRISFFIRAGNEDAELKVFLLPSL